MAQKVRFQDTLRRVAVIDEGFIEHEARLGLDPAAGSALDPRTAALLQVGVAVAMGSSPVCLEWTTGRALAAGASEDEIADVLLVIAPVAGLGQPARIVDGRPEGPYTGAFEIICCDCGDDPGLEYAEVSSRLQLFRGPYLIADGIAAYETHLSVHHQTEMAHGQG